MAHRGTLRGSAVAVLILTLAACTADGADDAEDAAVGPTQAAAVQDAQEQPALESTPEPTESPRPMEVGDCLNKVDVDELGLPIPEYIDCAEPHMFEVTAVYRAPHTGTPFDFEAFDDARKAECRKAYETYTGRDSKDIGNAFGWDQPQEAAYAAGEYTVVCYATAPNFDDLVGSVRR